MKTTTTGPRRPGYAAVIGHEPQRFGIDLRRDADQPEDQRRRHVPIDRRITETPHTITRPTQVPIARGVPRAGSYALDTATPEQDTAMI